MFPTQSDHLPVFDEYDPSIFEPLFENPLMFEKADKIELADSFDALRGNEVTEKATVRKRARKTSPAIQIRENKNNDASKKTVRREIEKQRRHEIAGLYASLRSLLPLDYVKEKRGISDHMQQAVDYIKDTQKKIEELKIKKHKLKTMSSTVPRAENSKSTARFSQYCVKVNLFRDGVFEILIKSGLKEENFPLSKVLAYLLSKGLNVTACVSTRGDEYSLHKLQIELNETTSIDLSELQDRLVNLIKLF